MKRQSVGFTLVEGLIALAIGGAVIGGAMLLYLQGTRSFVKVTEHTTFRTEAILLLERITRELDEIVVTDQLLADGTAHLTRPFALLDPAPLPPGPAGGEPVPAANGIRFYKFHRVEMTAAGDQLAEGIPRLVARQIEYRAVPLDPGDPTKGLNLLRNGKPMNKVPLRYVLFRKVPREVSDRQIRGSPHAILRIDIVPKGGMWDELNQAVIDNLASRELLVSRTHHLVGYESMYTAVLSNALEALRPPPGGAAPDPAAVLAPVPLAVFRDAYQVVSPALLAVLEETDRNASTFPMPRDSAYLLEEKLHDDAGGDPFFEAAIGGA